MRIEVVDGEEGWRLAEALDAEVYPPDVMASVLWRDVTWADADKHVLVVDREGVRCHAGVFWREGTWNGDAVRMAGIGAVMTSTSARRRGYAGAAMGRAAALMKEHRIDFGLLFCEPHNGRLYANLGWHVFGGEVWTEQPQGKIRFDMMHAMVLPLGLSPDCGVIELCGLPW